MPLQAAPGRSPKNTSVLIVDDDAQVLESLLLLLDAHGYAVTTACDAAEALSRMESQSVDVVLTDIRMPGMNGLELAGKLHESDPDIPLLIMTGYADLHTAVSAVKSGAFDFILKPLEPDHLIHAVGKAADFRNIKNLEKNYKHTLEMEVAEKTKELRDLNREIIHRLTVVSEYRDTDTGHHISRIGSFSGVIARELGMPPGDVDVLSLASSLHDIGKVAIPDSILLKPGSLSREEFAVIKTHTTLGAGMLSGSKHDVIRMAEAIARYHHERWDGGGYPEGRRGEEIPVEARTSPPIRMDPPVLIRMDPRRA